MLLVDESALANTITTSVALANLWGFQNAASTVCSQPPLSTDTIYRHYRLSDQHRRKLECDMYCRSKLYLFLQTTLYVLPTCYKALHKYVVFYSITNLLCSTTIHKHSQIQTHIRSLLDVKSATSNLILTTTTLFFCFPFSLFKVHMHEKFLKSNHFNVFIFINLLVSAKTKEKWKYSKDIENK